MKSLAKVLFGSLLPQVRLLGWKVGNNKPDPTIKCGGAQTVFVLVENCEIIQHILVKGTLGGACRIFG